MQPYFAFSPVTIDVFCGVGGIKWKHMQGINWSCQSRMLMFIFVMSFVCF